MTFAYPRPGNQGVLPGKPALGLVPGTAVGREKAECGQCWGECPEWAWLWGPTLVLVSAAQNVTVEEVIGAYKQACQKLSCRQIPKLLRQLQVQVGGLAGGPGSPRRGPCPRLPR